MSDLSPCRSYRQGKSKCADGFLQVGYCWNGRTGVYNRPMCLSDDIPDHYMKVFMDDSGKPKKINVVQL